jgi:hypothetical protein
MTCRQTTLCTLPQDPLTCLKWGSLMLVNWQHPTMWRLVHSEGERNPLLQLLDPNIANSSLCTDVDCRPPRCSGDSSMAMFPSKRLAPSATNCSSQCPKMPRSCPWMMPRLDQ